MFAGQLFIILISLWLQFGSRNYRVEGWFLEAFALIAVVYVFFFVPESPAFLEQRGFSIEDYQQSRATLKLVANTNGVQEIRGQPYERFRFVNEYKKFPDVDEQALIQSETS